VIRVVVVRDLFEQVDSKTGVTSLFRARATEMEYSLVKATL